MASDGARRGPLLTLYLDTPLLVSALTNEAGTLVAQAWLARQDITELTVSDWVVTEFSSALSIKLRTAQFEPDHRAAALSAFTRLCAETFRILPVSRAAFRTAARFADQSTLNLCAGDALHLAICAEAGATFAPSISVWPPRRRKSASKRCWSSRAARWMCNIRCRLNFRRKQLGSQTHTCDTHNDN